MLPVRQDHSTTSKLCFRCRVLECHQALAMAIDRSQCAEALNRTFTRLRLIEELNIPYECGLLES